MGTCGRSRDRFVDICSNMAEGLRAPVRTYSARRVRRHITRAPRCRNVTLVDRGRGNTEVMASWTTSPSRICPRPQVRELLANIPGARNVQSSAEACDHPSICSVLHPDRIGCWKEGVWRLTGAERNTIRRTCFFANTLPKRAQCGHAGCP